MYFLSVLGFMWIAFLWERYLDFRQRAKLLEKERPKAITEFVSQEKFDKAQSYGLDKSSFGLVKSLVSILEDSLSLWFGVLPFLWSYSNQLLAKFGYSDAYEVSASIVFIILLLGINLVSNLPFELYYTFVLEEKHGFNKMTLQLFISDKIKVLDKEKYNFTTYLFYVIINLKKNIYIYKFYFFSKIINIINIYIHKNTL